MSYPFLHDIASPKQNDAFLTYTQNDFTHLTCFLTESMQLPSFSYLMALLYARWIQDVAFLQGKNRPMYAICRRPHIFFRLNNLSRQGKARQGPETSIHIGYICA
jgi:hypothetical protein